MKKQISLWLAVIMVFGAVATFAQKPFAGTITFATTAEGTDDPNVAAELADMTQEVIVMGNNTKTVINQSGVGIINIANGDYKLVTTVIDIPGYGKYYIERDENDIKKSFELSENYLRLANQDTEELTIRKLTYKNPTMKAKFDEARNPKDPDTNN